MLLSLTGICVVAGAVLAAVNNLTAGPIVASKAAALETAIKAVTPEFNNKPSEESYMVATPEGDSLHTEGKLCNYSVLQHAETPGLGAKMQEWFRTDKNKQSIIGRKLDTNGLKVSKDGGDVDAITAATISSRAFLDAVNRAYSAYAGTDAVGGATSSK